MNLFIAELLRLQQGPHAIFSIFVLLSSSLVLLYGLYAFAHARLLNADLGEISRLHNQGLLRAEASVEENYRELAHMLNEIAPAVYMRQEIWIKWYYYVLRAATAFSRYSEPLNLEMRRLLAYQCSNYREACARMEEIRAIS
jgi:hypothetical protein